jgi:hypothetical protein
MFTDCSVIESYLLEVLVEVVEPLELLFLDFLCFVLVLFMLPVSVEVLLVEVFCANIAVTGRSEKPRAAIISFFIWGYLLIS